MLKGLYFALPASVRRILRPLIHPLLTLVEREVGSYSPEAIVSGPFRGMKIDRKRAQPLAIPTLLGTYELELHNVFTRLAYRQFATIIDIGAAEGYYAVGALLWKPHARVIAYEANPKYHESIRALAETNGVSDRIEVKGSCGIEDLKQLEKVLPRSFLIMDVEGYEKQLLDPEEIPPLREATILVEVHDNFVEGCSEAITRRFESSHAITAYKSRPRNVQDYPIASRLSRLRLMRGAIKDSISDGRTAANGWLFLVPKLGGPY